MKLLLFVSWALHHVFWSASSEHGNTITQHVPTYRHQFMKLTISQLTRLIKLPWTPCVGNRKWVGPSPIPSIPPWTLTYEVQGTRVLGHAGYGRSTVPSSAAILVGARVVAAAVVDEGNWFNSLLDLHIICSCYSVTYYLSRT